MAGLAILIEVLVIVIRFCNIGLVNLMIKGFLIVVSDISEMAEDEYRGISISAVCKFKSVIQSTKCM